MSARATFLLFGLIVTLCLGQIGWWIYFQIRETEALERAAALLDQGRTNDAARELGADASGSLTEHSRRRRIMFISEGATLSLLILIGVVFLYSRVRREQKMRSGQKRFLTGATHELKTPLATLRLGLESLLAGSTPDSKREPYLHAMIGQVERLERDVGNLLTAAGLEETGRRLHREAGPLEQDLHNVIAEVDARFEAAGIELCATAIDAVQFPRDSEAMRVIVRNLLDNALKYCSRGDRVEVALRRQDGHAVLRIADTGAGMTGEELGHVFEQFYRGPSGAHVGGSGLGLHLVDQLVTAHGGAVEARSPGPGQGSEFIVRLPLTTS